MVRPLSVSTINRCKVVMGEMGRACSMNGGEEECIEDIGGKSRREEITGKTKT
jgi:hypothetical protein